MRERISEGLRDLWLPVLVGLAGVLISLAFWGVLVADRRDHLLDSTAEIAAETARSLELHVGQQVQTLRGLGELWSELGLPSSEASRAVEWLPGLTSLVWIDLEEPGKRITVGEARSAAQTESDLERALLHGRRPHLVGPEHEASGGIGYRIFLPVRTPEDRGGALVGVFRIEPFLEGALRGHARGHALTAYWKGQEIFSRGEASTDPWQRWWRVEQTVSLPLGGGGWRMVHRPTPALAAARLTPLPHYLLATGILLSIVLAVVVYQLRVIARQSRFLAASNLALERRGLELESEVARRTEELSDAVSELEAFNYSVSHDLRSPLGAILNFIAILEEDHRGRPLDERGMALLERIRRSATRATTLLEDLLQLSRAGRAALTFEPVDMTSLARETFAQVRAAEDDTDVEFRLDPLPPAMGDRALLGDVLANLFSNALKYSRGCEKRRIAVGGRVEGGEGGFGAGEVVYEIRDNGHGFDMRFSDKLFGLFERLHDDDDFPGTGVGLAMVARIVKRHGGRAWAEGRPGEGAVFSFSLPIREGGTPGSGVVAGEAP